MTRPTDRASPHRTPRHAGHSRAARGDSVPRLRVLDSPRRDVRRARGASRRGPFRHDADQPVRRRRVRRAVVDAFRRLGTRAGVRRGVLRAGVRRRVREWGRGLRFRDVAAGGFDRVVRVWRDGRVVGAGAERDGLEGDLPSFAPNVSSAAGGDGARPRSIPAEETDALDEVRMAVEQLVIPHQEPVELLPRDARLLAMQKELIEREYRLEHEECGEGNARRIRILHTYVSPRDAKGVVFL